MELKTRAKTGSKKIDKISQQIDYPKEVEILDMLNKKNREAYLRWLRRKLAAEDILGKSTLIIGVRGKDGIVLGADTKTTRGQETDFEEKLKSIVTVNKAPIVFAGAGAVGVIEDFIEIFEKTLRTNLREGKITSLLTIKIIAEDLVAKAEERYGPKLGQPPLHFIFGGLSELNTGEARLYEIGSPGYGQKIKYCSLVGHGSPYARTIAKYLFPRSRGVVPLNCKEIVPRIAACIYWIQEEIDDSVGGDPQIVYVSDKNPEIKRGTYNKTKISKRVAGMKRNIAELTF